MRGLIAIVAASGCGFQVGGASGLDGGSSDGGVDTAPQAWFGTYARRREVTLKPTLTAPLVDQQVFIVSKELTLRASGTDLAFTTTDDVLLPFELELTSPTATHAWVRIPTLAAGAATTLYLYYDDPLTPSVEDVAATWDASHLGVFHLTSRAGMYRDSARGNHGTPMNMPSDVEGLAAGAIGIQGGAHVVAGAGTTALMQMTPTRSFSYSAWAYVRSSLNGFDVVMFKADDPQDIGWDFQLGTGSWEAAMGRGGNSAHARIADDGAAMHNRWMHLGAIVDRGTQVISSYLDGALVGTANTSSVGDLSSNFPLLIGFPGWPGDMLIDEVRVYDGAIDPRRFAVERDNLASTTFVTVGPEQLKAP